jgi:HAD superfamily hydrolase (TIGR01549 family)
VTALRQLDGVRMIWFDLDQTLCDHESASLHAILAVRRMDPRWLMVPEARWADEYGAIRRQVWDEFRQGRITWPLARVERFRRLMAAFGLPDDRVEWLAEKFLGIYEQAAEPMPGVLECLATLRERGWPMGVITDGDHDLQLRRLKRSGLDSYFGRLVAPQQTGAFKPDAAVFDYAAERAGLRAESLLYVGDSVEMDVEGALGARWNAVWVNADVEAPPIDGVPSIGSLAELPAILPDHP